MVQGLNLEGVTSLKLDLARWSNAFGGTGKGSRKGVERGRLVMKDERIECTWHAGFDEFGPVSFCATSTLALNLKPNL